MNYVIMAQSNRIIKEEINKIVKNDLITYYNYLETSLDDILFEASTVDLFSTAKYLIVYETDFKKEDLNKLENYLSNPSINSLIFVSNKSIKTPNNIEVINKLNLNYKDYKPMLIKYLNSFGYKADEETIFYIMDTCLYNYDLMLNEVDKIMLYYNKPCMINIKDVKKIVSKNIVDNSSKLFSAILKKDYQKMFKIYNDLRILKIDNYYLTTILGKSFANLLIVKELLEEGLSKKDIVRETKLRDFVIDEYLKYERSFSIDDLKDYIVKLAKIDYQLKTGTIIEEHALSAFLLGL